MKQRTFRLCIWCESCVEAKATKSKQDHEKKNPEAGKDSFSVPYPIIQLGVMFLQCQW